MIDDDFELEPGLTIGDWAHQELQDTTFVETEGWAPERVQRVAARLQTARPIPERYQVEVLWIQPITAFTLPGRYIYCGRRLLDHCPDDETVAFVIAHEIAHHDLGHLRLLPHWMAKFAHQRMGAVFVFAMDAVERRLYGPERECDADRTGLALCIQAGYDPEKCLRWFPIFEQVMLDLEDDAMVYGPNPEVDELSPDASWTDKVRLWAWQRTRGYLPMMSRHEALKRYLKSRIHG